MIRIETQFCVLRLQAVFRTKEIFFRAFVRNIVSILPLVAAHILRCNY